MLSPEDSEQVLRRFVNRETKASLEIEALVRAALRSAGRMVPPHSREDIVQETLLEILQQASRPTFRIERNLPAFVRRVTACNCIDHFRKERRFRSPRADPERDCGSDGPDTVVDPYPGPDRSCELEEERQILERALGSVSAEDRKIIRLHIYDKLPWAEISSLLGKPEGTLKSRLCRSLRRMRRHLTEDHE